MVEQLLDYVEVVTGENPQACVIWMHGLGADGHDFEDIVSALELPQDLPVRFIFPHAPVRAITLNGGLEMRAWFDVYGLSLETPQDEVGIRASEEIVFHHIAHQLAEGVAADKIVLAGFSQGAAMALHCALRYPKQLAGAIALSGFLPLAKTVAGEVSGANSKLPIFMAHGQYDEIVSLEWGEASKNELLVQGYQVNWQTYPMPHSICPEEITDLGVWLTNILRA